MIDLLARWTLRVGERFLDPSLTAEAVEAMLRRHGQDVHALPPTEADAPTRDEALRWMASLAEGRVLHRGVLAPQSGRMLDVLAAETAAEIRAFVADNAERLLVHVEVRRQRCLAEIAPGDAPTDRWHQRHGVAIFFSRQARRAHDVRFLNAALKMNDWAYPAHRGRCPPARLALYLRALAEQECAAKELLS